MRVDVRGQESNNRSPRRTSGGRRPGVPGLGGRNLLLLIGLAVLCASLLIIPWVVQAQSQEVTPTAAATGETPPAQPTNLQAAAEHDAVTLTWTASTDQSVTHYAILRRNRDTDALGVFHVIESNAGPETSYTDGSVAAASRYGYRAKAVSPTGVSQWSGFVKADTPAAPDPTPTPDPTPPPEPESDPADLAPTNLTATLAEGGGVTLTWSAPAEDADSVTGYEVLRTVGQGEPATLATDTASTATVYTDATATGAGETYAYQVKAVRGEERSQASGQAQVQAQLLHDSVDLAPTGLTAVIFTAVVVGEEFNAGVGLTWSAPAEDADSVTGYEVLRAVGDGEPATLVDDTGSTATTYIDATAAQSGETYAYQVKAIRGEERSQASDRTEVQLPHDPVDLAPSYLTAAFAEGGGLTLAWTAPAEETDSVTGYQIVGAVGDGEPTTLAADTGSTATAYTDATATTAGETYAYQVKAVRDGVLSEASAQAAFELPEAIVSICEFDAGGSDLPADTSTACVLAVDGSVRGERATADDADWYRVGLQAGATYQIDMRGKSTGEWELVDGAPAFVSVGTLEDPKLLGIYDASGALVPGSDSEVAGTGKDSRIASFSPDADGVYYIAASAESGWTGTYELSLTVAAGEHVAGPTVLEPLSTSLQKDQLDQVELSPQKEEKSDDPTDVFLPSQVFDPVLIPPGDVVVRADDETQPLLVGNTSQDSNFSELLTSDQPKQAQEFTTGASANGYSVASIGISFADIDDTTTAAGELTATINEKTTNAANEAIPGGIVCTLDDPASYTADSINYYSAPSTGCTLSANTTYFVVLERANIVSSGNNIGWSRATNNTEDTGGAIGWTLGNFRTTYWTAFPKWLPSPSQYMMMEIRGEAEATLIPDDKTVTERLLVGNTDNLHTSFNQRLRTVSPAYGQGFTTGASPNGYSVTSVGIAFGAIPDLMTAASELTATINLETDGSFSRLIPGGVVCTLEDPANFTADSVNYFTAPTTGCILAANTNYYVVVERDTSGSGNLRWRQAASSAADSGSALGWTIANNIVQYLSGSGWPPSANRYLGIEVKGAAAAVPNITATGRPILKGAPYVGGTLSADISGIEDENGLDSGTFAYQWVLIDGGDETDIAGATERSYTLTAGDEGKRVKVKIAFTDNEEYSEGPLDSDPSGAVKPAQLTQVLIGNTGQDPDENPAELTSETPKFAQGFTTGTESSGYSVSSVGIEFATIADPATAASELTATINEATTNSDNESIPGDVLCTLADPATYLANSVNYFTAPPSGCALAPGATYFVVLERANDTTDAIEALATDSDDEDSGGAPGWSIGNGRHFLNSIVNIWISVTVDVLMIEVKGPEAVLNVLATGRVEITGLTRVGYPLTADTSLISDGNGVPGRFTYQWVRVDGGDETDIAGATDQTYTLTDEDEGKTIKVKVEFMDLDGFAEEPPTSAATSVIRPYVLNSSATGAPAINGTAQVGVQLSVNTSAITDANGLPGTFSYQWVRVVGTSETDIDRATEPRYIPGPADEGKMLRVRVEFIDDDGFGESLLSVPTVAVVAAPVTAASSKSLWTATLTVGTRTGDSTTGYSADHSGALSPAAFDDRTNIHGPTGATFTIVTDDQGNKVIKRLGPITTTYTVRSVVLSSGDLTFKVSPILPDTAATWKLKVGTGFSGALSSTNRTDDTATGVSTLTWTGAGLSFTSGQTVAIELEIVNSLASGTLTVDGTPEVGERLAADVSGISDANGKPERALVYSYQWFADGTSLGDRATAQHYWPTQDDVGQHLSVSVSYVDEDGFEEGPIYGSETVAVQASDGVLVPLSGTMEVYYRRVDTLKMFNAPKGHGSMYPTEFDVGINTHTVSLAGYKCCNPDGLYLGLDAALPGDFELFFADRPGLDSGEVTSSVSTGRRLDGTYPAEAQGFTTGGHKPGYGLSSIGIRFGSIADTSTAGSELTVTLNEEDRGKPGDALCTLRDPSGFSRSGLHTFSAPTTGTDRCPKLSMKTTYFVVVTRTNDTASAITFDVTERDDEDAGGPAGWSVGNRAFYRDIWSWNAEPTAKMMIEVSGSQMPPAVDSGEVALLVKNTEQPGNEGSMTRYGWEGDVYVESSPYWYGGDRVAVAIRVENLRAGQPLIGGTVAQGATLWADLSQLEDPNGLPDTFLYRWMLVDGQSETDIPGATARTYKIKPTDVGKDFKVRVSWTDATGFFNSAASELKTSPVPQVRSLSDRSTSERTIWSATMTVGGSLATTSVTFGGVEYPFLTGKVGYGADVSGHLSDTQFTYRGVTYTVDHLTWDWKTGLDGFGPNRSTPISLGISPLPYESAYGEGGEWILLSPAGDQVGFKTAEHGALFTEVYIDYNLNQAFPTSASVVGTEVRVALKVRNYEPKRMAIKNVSRNVRSFERIPLAIVGDILSVDKSTIEDPNGISPGSLTVEWWELPGSNYADRLSDQSREGSEDYEVGPAALGVLVQPIVKYSDLDGFKHRIEGPRFGPVTHPTTGDYPYVVESTNIDEPGIKLSWITRAQEVLTLLDSIPARIGTDIHRFEQTDAGHYGKNATKVGELVLCDWDDDTEDIDSCLSAGTVEALTWAFVDETAEAGVSYSYWIKPYQEFFSTDGVNKWVGDIEEIEDGNSSEPDNRVREYSKHGIVRKRLPLDGEPGSPTNPDASQPNSGGCTGNCVRLTWDAADNATYYKVLGADGSVKHAPRIDASDTTFDHKKAELGQTYYYRIVAFTVYTDTDGEGNSRTRTLRSAGDALLTYTVEDASVPKQVPDFDFTADRISGENAPVFLTWAAPNEFDLISTNKYVIQYRLDVPGHSEWDDWEALAEVKANANRIEDKYQHTDALVLEAWYLDEDTSNPVEWVPRRDKGTLNLHNSDTSDDWILPFGITYEYRIRAVTPTKKGPWTIISVRIPNPSGVPGTVKIYPHVTGYAPHTNRARPNIRALETSPQLFNNCLPVHECDGPGWKHPGGLSVGFPRERLLEMAR